MKRVNCIKIAAAVSLCAALLALFAGCSGKSANITFDEYAKPYFTVNNCSVSYDKSEAAGVTVTCLAGVDDPFVSFDLKTYANDFKTGDFNCDDYKYVVVKFRCDSCSDSQFTLFYLTDIYSGYSGELSKTVSYDNSDGKWQYICFDMSDSEYWKGNLTSLRFDFERVAVYSGEGVTLASVAFYANENAANKLIESNGGSLPEGLTADELKESKTLISSAKTAVSDAENKAVKAENEDSSINMWFQHTYVKVPAEDITPSGMYTYTMRLAKNEIETCQAILASDTDKTGLTAKLSDFTNESGDVLRSGLFYGYYFDDVDGETIADPIPELRDAFDLTAGKSKILLVKVYSDEDTAAGMYSAVLSIYDQAGNEIKRANVYACIWNFTLPEETSCKTLADLSWWGIYSATKKYEGDDGYTYKLYYDYLLENRICSYTLPYDTGGTFSDDRINEYLDNPRVTAFQAIGWKTELNASTASSAYMYLSQKPAWLEKAYFYPVDEPASVTMLDTINDYGKLLKEVFPGYKLIVPMHVNTALSQSGDVDYFEYVKEYVNIWCPHTYFFTSYENYKADTSLTYRSSAKIESKLGSLAERLATEQSEGDEVWWYVTRFPQTPEITLTINTDSVNYRTLFWQQKLYNVDGFLYYSVTDWYGYDAWDKKHETDESYPYNVYGNGVLIYWGSFVGEDGAVGSLRLEGVRDGIEDYEYFTLLDELYGEGASDLVIKRWTTSLGEYSTDTELFTELRTAVGNLIEAKLAGSN